MELTQHKFSISFPPVLAGGKLVKSHVLFAGLTVRKPEKTFAKKGLIKHSFSTLIIKCQIIAFADSLGLKESLFCLLFKNRSNIYNRVLKNHFSSN